MYIPYIFILFFWGKENLGRSSMSDIFSYSFRNLPCSIAMCRVSICQVKIVSGGDFKCGEPAGGALAQLTRGRAT